MGGRGGGSNGSSGAKGKSKKEEKAEGGGGEMSTAKALDHYQNKDAYQSLNENLRGGKETTKFQKEMVKGMDKGMEKLGENATVFRGMGNKVGEQILKAGEGGIISDKGYTSTSGSKGYAHQQTGFGYGWKGQISLNKDSKVLDVNKAMGRKSKMKGEKEVIVGRGNKFGVVSINAKTKTVQLVHLSTKAREAQFRKLYGG